MLNDNKLLNWIVFLAPVIVAKAPDFIASSSKSRAQNNVEQKTSIDGDPEFLIDTAKLQIYKQGLAKNDTVNISTLSDYCYSCSFYVVDAIPSRNDNKIILVDTRWPITVKLHSTTINCSAQFHYFFGERGIYNINFTSSVNGSQYTCSLTTIHVQKKPWYTNAPIAVAFAILLALAVFYAFGRWFYKNRRTPTEQLIAEDFGDPNTAIQEQRAPAIPQQRERMKSIDTFRGLSIVIMIFVNFKGGYYWFFRHSAWNGLTVADLVFPWFMFIMGVNITLSVESLVKRNTPKREIVYKVVRRTLILFALGIFIINHNTNWETLRVPGVLQRFAVGYLFAFLIQWAFHKFPAELDQQAMKDEDTLFWWYPIRDVVLYWQQWIIVLALETLWITLTFLLPVPNCPTGYLGPGGLADESKYMDAECIGGAAGYIDRWMFGNNHIYGHSTAKAIYYPMLGKNDRLPYDPEGVLGSINGCVIVFLGSQMGKIFLYYKGVKARCVRWFAWSLVLGVISIILCKASANEGWIPVNKNLWTTTFITTLSSMAFFLMILLYLLVDVLKWWSGSPLDFVGMNSILVYVGHETFHSYLPFSWGATEYSTHAEWLAMNMLGVFYWVLIAYYCYKINFFVKI